MEAWGVDGGLDGNTPVKRQHRRIQQTTAEHTPTKLVVRLEEKSWQGSIVAGAIRCLNSLLQSSCFAAEGVVWIKQQGNLGGAVMP